MREGFSRRAGLRVLDRKVGPMKACFRQILALVLIAAAVFLASFLLLFTGRLTLAPNAAGGLVFFALAALLPGLGLPLLTVGILRSPRSMALVESWQCGGKLGVLGGAGAVIAALLTMLAASRELALYLGVSLVCALLVLYLGGLVCFLHRYLDPRCGCDG